MPDVWPDVAILERPGPGLPPEYLDPSIAAVDPLELAVHDDRYQLYVRRHPEVLRVALRELEGGQG